MSESADTKDEKDLTPTGEPGAKGGDESPSADTLPGLPSKDGTPLGDTDQHSNA